jgi:transposase-like protein
MPRPNRYPPEFRRDVVELVRSTDKTIAQVARGS